MSVDENKALYQRVIDVYNNRDWDALSELFAADFVGYISGSREINGLEGLKQYLIIALTPLPDLQYTIHDIIAEGDKVVGRYSAAVVQKGGLRGSSPPGNQLKGTGIAIYRIAGGKFKEAWWESNKRDQS